MHSHTASRRPASHLALGRYLSLFPDAIERALVSFGLAPIGRSAEDVYAATYRRMMERSLKYYRRYPDDVELVRAIVTVCGPTLNHRPASLSLQPRLRQYVATRCVGHKCYTRLERCCDVFER